MDSSLLLDLNHLVKHGAALTDVVRLYGEVVGVALLLVCLLVVAVSSRRGGIGNAEGPGWAALLAAFASGPIAYGAARVLQPLIGQRSPADSSSQVVAVFHDGAHTMPDPLSAGAFGLAAALVVVGSRRIAILGVLLAILEAVAVVAGGAAWPSDVGVGAGLGLVVAALVAGVRALLGRRAPRAAPAGAHHLVAGVQPGRNAVDGPAAHPRPDAATGAVRVLSTGTIRPATARASEASPPGVPSS